MFHRFKKGILAGDVNAHLFLGRMMLDGDGFRGENHDLEAATYLQVAAEANNPQAIHYLALMYEYGRGVMQNFGKKNNELFYSIPWL